MVDSIVHSMIHLQNRVDVNVDEPANFHNYYLDLEKINSSIIIINNIVNFNLNNLTLPWRLRSCTLSFDDICRCGTGGGFPRGGIGGLSGLYTVEL